MAKRPDRGFRPDVQYGFLLDQRRCTGCKTCEIACKDFHDLPGELALRTVLEYVGGTWRADGEGAWTQDVFCYHVSTSCNHCSNPVCVRFCLGGALAKGDGGLVSINPALCVGCQSCLVACPYHAPRFDDVQGVAVKCDGCVERLRAGRGPICVEACPQRALSFGPYASLADDPEVVAAVAPLPSPEFTQPNLVVRPCVEARPVGDSEGRIANLREA